MGAVAIGAVAMVLLPWVLLLWVLLTLLCCSTMYVPHAIHTASNIFKTLALVTCM